jgi:hypothetical protein
MDYYGDTSVSDDGMAHGDVSGESLGNVVESAMRRQEGRSSPSSKSSSKSSSSKPLSNDEQLRRLGAGTSKKLTMTDMEEYASRVARKNGAPNPYMNGLAHTGARDARLEPHHQTAARNGTSLADATADYVAAENAWRQDPHLGIDFTAKRLGIDSRTLAYTNAVRHGWIQDERFSNVAPIHAETQNYASRVESDNAIATLMADPRFEHLTTSEGQQGILAVLNTKGPNGQTINEGLMQRGFNAMQRLQICYQEYDRQTMRDRTHNHYAKQRADSEDADRRIRAASRHVI